MAPLDSRRVTSDRASRYLHWASLVIAACLIVWAAWAVLDDNDHYCGNALTGRRDGFCELGHSIAEFAATAAVVLAMAVVGGDWWRRRRRSKRLAT